MNLLVATDARRETGLGHLTRSLAVARAHAALGGSFTLVVNGDGTGDGLLAGLAHRLEPWAERPERLLDEAARADALLVDSYFPDAALVAALAGASPRPAFFDDERRLDPPRGLLVNPALHAATLGYAARPGLTLLLGADFAALRPAFIDPSPHRPPDTVSEALVLLGGGDPRPHIAAVAAALAAALPAARRRYALPGPAGTAAECRALDPAGAFLVAPGEAELAAAMAAAGLAVSAAGQTLHELARVGTPFAAFLLADNQRHNLEFWSREGIAAPAGDARAPGFVERLASAVRALIPREERERRSALARSRVDGRGAERIARAIADYSSLP